MDLKRKFGSCLKKMTKELPGRDDDDGDSPRVIVKKDEKRESPPHLSRSS